VARGALGGSRWRGGGGACLWVLVGWCGGVERRGGTYGVGGMSPVTERAFRREASCISSSKALRFSMTFRSRMRASKSFCAGNVLLAFCLTVELSDCL
jgi:hypothetical protein